MSSHARVENPPVPPGQPVYVRVHRVSATGSDYIRFLGDYDGLYIHYVKPRSHVCLGDRVCLPHLHRVSKHWKGYAAAELWLDKPTFKFAPVVIELTARLAESIDPIGQRGIVWRMWREAVGGERPEVLGEVHRDDSRANLRKEFDFRSSVSRMYSAPSIPWGAIPLLPPRVIEEMVDGESPLPPLPEPEKQGPKLSMREREIEYQKKKAAQAAANGKEAKREHS